MTANLDLNNSEYISDGKISARLAGAIILLLVTLFVITGLLIRESYYRPPVARTALERDLIKFQDRVDADPDDIDARIGLAGTFLQLNKPEKAIAELDYANKVCPDSSDVLLGLGMAYEGLNNPKEAILYYRKASRIDMTNELPFYKLGKVYMSQKLYASAIDAFKRTLKINPTLADAHYCLGLCYETTDNTKMAKHEYRQALKYIDNYPEAKKALRRLQ
jgi:tetratricopeptide (TPR) repeat protein